MKKWMSLLLALAMLALSGCHRLVAEPDEITVACSFYPLYALARGVGGDVPGLTLACLTQPQDGCLRNYQLSDWDAYALNTADALLLGGRGLESFESAVMGGAMPVSVLMRDLTLVGQDNPAPAGDDEASHLTGANPWLWLSVDGARALSGSIAQTLIQLDPKYRETYENNLSAVDGRLTALQKEMRALVPGGMVALMHEGLIYLADTLNLTVAARIDRESATAVDPNMIEEVAASGARVVLIERQAPQSAITALENAGFRVALIDTLATHTESDPETYYSAMKENARAVAQALS